MRHVAVLSIAGLALALSGLGRAEAQLPGERFGGDYRGSYGDRGRSNVYPGSHFYASGGTRSFRYIYGRDGLGSRRPRAHRTLSGYSDTGGRFNTTEYYHDANFGAHYYDSAQRYQPRYYRDYDQPSYYGGPSYRDVGRGGSYGQPRFFRGEEYDPASRTHRYRSSFGSGYLYSSQR